MNWAGGYISADLGDSSHDTRGRCKCFLNSLLKAARKRKCLVDRSGQRFLDNVRHSSSESILIYVLKKKEGLFVADRNSAIKKGKLVNIPIHAHASPMQT